MAMNEKRRAFLSWSKRAASAGILTAAGGAAAWRVIDRDVFSVSQYGRAPEQLQKGELSPENFKKLCAAAIQAPSLQNSQPWAFQVTPAGILVFADLSRKIGTLDPQGRQLFLSIGCAIANIEIAARASGLSVVTDISIDEETISAANSGLALVASIQFSDSADAANKDSALYPAIFRRKTSRHPHDLGPGIPGSVTERLIAMSDTGHTKLGLFSHSAREHGQTIRLLADASHHRNSHTDRRKAALDWFRCEESVAQEKGDGIGIQAIGVSPIYLPLWKFWRCPTADGLAAFREKIATDRIPFSNFIGMILIPDQDRSSGTAMEAGRIWQRMILQATLDGLAVHPVNAIVANADFPNDKIASASLALFNKRVVRRKGWTPIMVFRLGLPTAEGGETPRRPLAEVLVS